MVDFWCVCVCVFVVWMICGLGLLCSDCLQINNAVCCLFVGFCWCVTFGLVVLLFLGWFWIDLLVFAFGDLVVGGFWGFWLGCGVAVLIVFPVLCGLFDLLCAVDCLMLFDGLLWVAWWCLCLRWVALLLR